MQPIYLGSGEQRFNLEQILAAEDGGEDPGELGSGLRHTCAAASSGSGLTLLILSSGSGLTLLISIIRVWVDLAYFYHQGLG